MVATREKKSSKKTKALPSKSLTNKQAGAVKGGWSGDENPKETSSIRKLPL